jgi:hypothetical protein
MRRIRRRDPKANPSSSKKSPRVARSERFAEPIPRRVSPVRKTIIRRRMTAAEFGVSLLVGDAGTTTGIFFNFNRETPGRDVSFASWENRRRLSIDAGSFFRIRMTLPIAMTADVLDATDAELDEARAVIGARKLAMRQTALSIPATARKHWFDLLPDLRPYNRRLDAINREDDCRMSMRSRPPHLRHRI